MKREHLTPDRAHNDIRDDRGYEVSTVLGDDADVAGDEGAAGEPAGFRPCCCWRVRTPARKLSWLELSALGYLRVSKKGQTR